MRFAILEARSSPLRRVCLCVRLGDKNYQAGGITAFLKPSSRRKWACKKKQSNWGGWIYKKPSIGVISMPTLKRTLQDILQDKKSQKKRNRLKSLKNANFRHNHE